MTALGGPPSSARPEPQARVFAEPAALRSAECSERLRTVAPISEMQHRDRFSATEPTAHRKPTYAHRTQ